MASTSSKIAKGQRVYDQFGAWTLSQDRGGWWVANQGSTSVLLLDQRDYARFGLVS